MRTASTEISYFSIFSFMLQFPFNEHVLAFWSTTLGPSRDMLEMTDLVLDVNDLALAAVLG